MFLQAKNSAELQKRILREKMQDEAAREQDHTRPAGFPKIGVYNRKIVNLQAIVGRSWPQEGKICVFVSSIFSHFSPVVCGLLGATLYNVQIYTNVLFKCIISDYI